jgi:hypothetical protein
MRQKVSWVVILSALALLAGANLARAQSSVAVTFTSVITGQTIDARSSPAQVTSDDESALQSKGYTEIGTISASMKSKKTDADIAQQLQAAILQKAAEAGGDFVRFTKTAETGTTGKNKNMVVSEGTVWRNDPQLAQNLVISDLANRVLANVMAEHPGASTDEIMADIFSTPAKPADSTPASPSAGTQTSPNAGIPLSSMLGKGIDSAEIKTSLSSLGTPQINKSSAGDYYSFQAEGVSLKFDTQNKLDAIFYYSEGADGFQQYKGDLPLGLTFQLTRKEIESILGPPDNSGGGATNIWTYYSSKGIGITYNTTQSDDLEARIHYISISAVR